MNTTTTPPVYKTIFPLRPNLHLVDKFAAEGKRIFVIGETLLFEGSREENYTMRTESGLVGGVTAY